MKKIICVLVFACVLFCLPLSANAYTMDDRLDDARQSGYESGYDDGYFEGYMNGYDTGYEKAYEIAYEQGKLDGISEAEHEQKLEKEEMAENRKGFVFTIAGLVVFSLLAYFFDNISRRKK